MSTRLDLRGVRVETVSAGIHDLYTTPIAGGGIRVGRFVPALLVTDWLSEEMDLSALQDLQPWKQRNPISDWPVGWARLLVRPLKFSETPVVSAVIDGVLTRALFTADASIAILDAAQVEIERKGLRL